MKLEEKSKARELRRSGKAITEISQIVKCSKSIVFKWTKDIALTEDQKRRLKYPFILLAEKKHALAVLRHAQFEADGLEWAKVDERFRLICALYWGEGGKTETSFRISNSDSSLIKVILNWLLSEGFEKKIRFDVVYHDIGTVEENEIIKWWNDKLEHLPEMAWTNNTKIDTRKYNCKKPGKLLYGTARITVHNTELFYNIMGGIKYLKREGP